MSFELCMDTELLGAPVADVVLGVHVHPFDVPVEFVLVRESLFALGAWIAGPVSRVNFLHVGF